MLAALIAVLALAAPASAQVQRYQHDDGLGFRNILPSGQNGLINPVQLAQYVASGTRPPHSDDQLRMYGNLINAVPGITAAQIPKYFKDASFGVRPGDVARTYSPRPDVTIERDKGFGIPHIYGRTRSGTMFGAGYAAAEDRLFFMDVLRHVGRGELSGFAGGALANRTQDEEIWTQAPYTEADFEQQYRNFPKLYGAEGTKLQNDVKAYIAGIQAYIDKARTDPSLMPGEYAAIGRPQGPENWKPTDLIATATLIGAIFGNGGGEELRSAQALQAAQARLGTKRGKGVWRDFRSAEDPEAPVTVHRKAFPYERPPKKVKKGSLAMPDRGSVSLSKFGASTGEGTSARAQRRGIADGLLDFPHSMSNALVVSGRESESGHPLAVFGPQVGYFNPQILNEVDIHGPGIDARGAAFNGVSLYVTLGRGRDYAWSATSAMQDIIDTFAVPLCNPAGGAVSKDSLYYRAIGGKCVRMEKLTRTNSWKPNLADSTPAGSETLTAYRTQFGIVYARATVKGKPVAYTRLRSTYMHEADSAIGISRFNDPNQIRGPRDFQKAAFRIPYTFHWFYVDPKQDAYFNSGGNPIRAKGTDPSLPTSSRFPWQGFNPTNNVTRFEPFRSHPQAIDQNYFVNWNNKAARGTRAADDNFEYSPIYRSKLLDDRVRRGIRGKRKMTLPKLVDAMETAGYADLRGDAVLPYMLRVLGRQKDPRLNDAIAKLRDWSRHGAPRRDTNGDHVYEYTDAVKIMDAWWPLLVKRIYEPILGDDAYQRLIDLKDIDNNPNNHGGHLGSSWQGGTYGLVQKDLRTVLGRKRLKGLKGPPKKGARFSRKYCGGTTRLRGSIKPCRAELKSTLLQALATSSSQLYGHDKICNSQPSLGPKDPNRRPTQWCFDSIWMRALGAAEQPVIPWINRPTFQQVVEIQRRVPR